MDVGVVIVQVYSVDMTKSRLTISVNNGGKRKKSENITDIQE